MVNQTTPVKELDLEVPDNAVGITLTNTTFIWKVPNTNYVYYVSTIKDTKSYIVFDRYLLEFLNSL